MSIKVLYSTGASQTIVSFLDDQSRARFKSVSKPTKGQIDAFEKRELPKRPHQIVQLFPDAIAEAVGGREALSLAPVFNLTGLRIALSDLRPTHLQASLIIGMEGKTPYLAYKIHYLVPGRLCGSLLVKETVGVIYGNLERGVWNRLGDAGPLGDMYLNKESLARLKRFFAGESLPSSLPIEEKASCCTCSPCSLCLFPLFRKCFFETDSVQSPYKMVLGS